MTSPADRVITLKDGRRFGHVEYGDPAGEPTFYLHGSPGNRLNPFLDDWGRQCGVRFLSVDRPGYGCSSAHPGRRLSDIGDDLAQLADRLGLERFSLCGVSGGGPAVLAAAARLGRRVRTAVVVSGVAPPQAPTEGTGASRLALLAAVRRNPGKHARQMGFAFWVARHLPAGVLDKAIAKGQADTPAPDRRLLEDEGVRRLLVAAARSLGHRDGRPMVADLELTDQPWDVDLADVAAHVQLWHGGADTSVPVAAARYVAEQLPDGHLHEVPDAGHLLFFQCWPEILAELVGAARSR